MFNRTVLEVIDELMPEGVEAVGALRSAAMLALPRSNTIADLFESVRATITQPETPAEANYVRVMSLHKSKGLTSKVVLVAGCVQGLIPVQDFDQTPQEQLAILQEQRRLFYVAITRCIEVLVLSSSLHIARNLAYRIGARVRAGGETIASQFLQELGPAAPQPLLRGDWRNRNYEQR